MSFATNDDITMNFVDENGVQKVEELGKVFITKGVWTTIVFKYRKIKDGVPGEAEVSVRRYQKRDGEYKVKSKFNISNADQGESICAAIQALFAPEEELVAA